MKYKFRCFCDKLSKFFAKIIIAHRKPIIVFAFLFLIGFITGIFTAAEYAKDLTCEFLINVYLYSWLIRESTYITFFLTMSVFYLIIVFCVSVFTMNKFLIILFSVFFVLGAYIYGFDICVVFVCLGLSGIVLGAITFGVLGLIITFLIILIFAIASKRCTNKLTKGSFCNNAEYFKVYLILAVISLLLLFLICFVFNIIHIFVIVE